MHCFEPLPIHPNYELRDKYEYTPDIYMNLVHMDISPPSNDDGNGEDEQQQQQQQHQPPQLQHNTATHSTTHPSKDLDEALTKLSALSFTSKPTRTEDDDDPFCGFEELDDSKFEIKTTTTVTSNSQTFNVSTTLEHVHHTHMRSHSLNLSTSPRGREQFFSKYKDLDDDDGGVGMEFESFVAKAEYSYVNNKIMEIGTVKEEVERSKLSLEDNPRAVAALIEVLTAKQKQIQRALDREKINKQDHNKLLERLNQVRDLLKHPKSGTW